MKTQKIKYSVIGFAVGLLLCIATYICMREHYEYDSLRTAFDFGLTVARNDIDSDTLKYYLVTQDQKIDEKKLNNEFKIELFDVKKFADKQGQTFFGIYNYQIRGALVKKYGHERVSEILGKRRLVH